MNPIHSSTIITTEYRFTIDPAYPVKTIPDGGAEITEVRFTAYSDGDDNIDFYGYRTRQDGARAANAAFGLIAGIPFDQQVVEAFNMGDAPTRQTLDTEVESWLAAYPKPATIGGTS